MHLAQRGLGADHGFGTVVTTHVELDVKGQGGRSPAPESLEQQILDFFQFALIVPNADITMPVIMQTIPPTAKRCDMAMGVLGGSDFEGCKGREPYSKRDTHWQTPSLFRR